MITKTPCTDRPATPAYSDRAAETVRGLRQLLGDDMRTVQERLRGPTRRPVRKHISNRTCHGKDVVCLPGLKGQCVACYDDD